MPNHCHNVLKITGSYTILYNFFIHHSNTEQLFTYTSDREGALFYNDHTTVKFEYTVLEYYFKSRWGPPVHYLLEISTTFSQLTFELHSTIFEYGKILHFTIRNGKIEQSSETEITLHDCDNNEDATNN